MGVLKDWSSIMECLTELDVFEALMTVVPYTENVEEQGHYVEAYMHNGFEGAFNKAFFEKEQEKEKQRKPYLGLFTHEDHGFDSEKLLSSFEGLYEAEDLPDGYEILSAIALPFVERGQISYALAESEGAKKVLYSLFDEEMRKEGVFTLPEESFGYPGHLFAHMAEPMAKYSEAVYPALTDREDSGVAVGYKEAMEKAKVEKILSGVARETKDARKHEIKVEMINREGGGEDFDPDEMLEKITERLRMMMAKGADGIYL